jgi:hypothetical protein
MSILGSIVDAIFGGSAAAATPPAAPAPGTAGSKTSGTPQPGTAGSKTSGEPQPQETRVAVNAPAAAKSVDVAANMDKLQAASKEKGLNWRKSIVDLMKLLDLDSSLTARKELAKELHYTGDTKDSSAMNQWLHTQVMIKLAENGGNVPAELKA